MRFYKLHDPPAPHASPLPMLPFLWQTRRAGGDNRRQRPSSAVSASSFALSDALAAMVHRYRQQQQVRRDVLDAIRDSDRGRYRSRNCVNARRCLGARRPLTTEAVETSERLRAKFFALEQRRSLLTSLMVNAQTRTQSHAVKVAEGFYSLLAHGYSPQRRPEIAEATAAYLKANMSSSVEWTTVTGVEPLLGHLQLYTDSYASLCVSLVDIKVVNQDPVDGSYEVWAEGTARVRINRTTLERFFPGVLENEYVAQQCIGQECTVEYNKVFYIRNGLIIRHGPFMTGNRLIHTPWGFALHVRSSIATTHEGLKQ